MQGSPAGGEVDSGHVSKELSMHPSKPPLAIIFSEPAIGTQP